MFGATLNIGYAVESRQLGWNVNRRPVYGWTKDASKVEDGNQKFGHFYVIIKAEKRGNNEFVYYIDPAETEERRYLEPEKLYCTRYVSLQEKVADLAGLKKEYGSQKSIYALQRTMDADAPLPSWFPHKKEEESQLGFGSVLFALAKWRLK